MVDDSKQIEIIMTELRDTSKEKRRTAVMKLGMLGSEDAIRALIRTVDNEYEDLIVRSRAAMLLGKIGDDRAVDPLIRALDAPGYQTPLSAAEALGRIGNTRAIPPLVFLAENSRDRLQETAQTALGKLGYNANTNTTGAKTDDIHNDTITEAEAEPEL